MANSPINPFLESPFDTVTDKIQQDRFTLPPLPAVSEADQPDATPAPAKPQPKAKAPSNTRRADDYTPPADLRPVFEAAARTFNVPVNVLMALGHQESRYDPMAVGKIPTEWGRAKGMMQYLDTTASSLGINPFDQYEAIPAAAKQIRERLDKGYSMEDAVKAHFAGDNRARWGKNTAAYGKEVMQKAAKIADALYPFDQSPEEVARRDRQRTEIEAQEEARRVKNYQPDEWDLEAAAQQKAINERGFFDRAGNALSSGYDNMLQSLNTARFAVAGGDSTELARSLSKKFKREASRPKTTGEQEIEAAFKAVTDANGAWDTVKAGAKAVGAAIANPKDLAVGIVEQAPNMLPTVAGGAGGAGAGGAAGAGVGALFGGIGALPGAATGAVWGGRAGMVAGTTATELGAEVEQMILERLEAKKAAPTEQNIKALLDNQAFQTEARNRGLKKGLTVALVDQIFLGLGGKVATAPARKMATKELADQGVDVSTRAARKAALASPAGRAALDAAKPSLGARAAAGGAAIGLDATGEVVGEAASQKVARGEVDAGDALREGVYGLGQSIVEPAIGAAMQTAKRAVTDNSPGAQLGRELDRAVSGAQFSQEGINREAVAALDPNRYQQQAAPTQTVTPPAPSQADGPLTRAVENAAEQPQRVTVTAPQGEISGFVQDIRQDDQGNTVTRVLGDDGQVYSFSSEEPIQIKPEGGPLTKALEKVASQEAPQIVATGETANDLGVRDVSQPSVEAAAQTGANQQGAGAGDQAGAANVRGDAGASEPGARAGVSGADQTAYTQPTLKDEHAGKWFGSKEKADAYIAKKQAGATHEVVQTGKVRWEIKPKAPQAAAVDGPAATDGGARPAPAAAAVQADGGEGALGQVFTGKSALYDGYGASIGSISEGNGRQLMVDPGGGYFWGDWRQESQRDVGAVAGGADKDATPATFATSKEAREAAAATPATKTAPTAPAQSATDGATTDAQQVTPAITSEKWVRDAADPFEGMNIPDQVKEYLLKPSVTMKGGSTVSAKDFVDGLLADGYGNPEYFVAPKGSQAGFLSKPGSPRVTLNDKQMFYADAAFMAKKQGEPAPAETKADARGQSGSASEPPLRGASPKQDAGPKEGRQKAQVSEPARRGPALVYRSDGSPFKTEQAARLAAKNRRLQGYEPVAVEGGFALAPAFAQEAQAAGDEAAPQPGEASDQQEIRRGEVGGKLESGEVVLTASGRETTPFPTIKVDTDRKTVSTVKAVDKWLMQNALDEARARGDQFNARQFEANLEKPSQADKGSAEEYLFGQQPEVVPSILKPLAGAEKKDQEAQAQARKSDSNATTTPEDAPAVPAAGAVTAEQKIRAAFEALPSITIGSWHPITVEHNGVKRQFLANQKSVDTKGRRKSPIHILTIKVGRMIAGAPRQYIANQFKLDGNDVLTEQGVPSAPTEGQLSKWRSAGFDLPALESDAAPDDRGDVGQGAAEAKKNDVAEAAKYLKDFVYSLGNLEGMTDRAQVALSSDLGKSGRDTLLMQAFGITREQAHEINNHLDARKPNNLRNEDMQEAFDLFPGLRKIVDGAVQQAAAREAKPTEPTPPTGGKSSDYGADNKLVSRERAAELRDRLKKKLSGSQLNAGIDPEILAIGTELAVFHLEAGARKFAAFAKAIASDLDMPVELLRPYLRSWYNGARDMMEDHGLSVAGMDSAEAVRAELAKMDNKPAATEPIRKTAKVYTPAGREIDVAYTVKEADDLIVSNDDSGRVNPAYPKELQPRDRTRAASDTQIQSIAGNLNPALLGESASTTDGAPIVSKDGVVESGNGRTLAIRRAYEQGNAEAYRKALADMGYNVEGMRRPVLVRERQTEMTPEERRAYTVESNQRTTLAMSASERAMADADQVKAIIDLYRGGDLNSAANRDFVRAFVGRLPDSERADLMDANGLLAQDGRRRIEGALLAAAYGDPSLVAELMESADSDIKSIGGALLDVAANWAQMREDSAAGRIADGLDVTPNLMEAVNLVRRARAEGRPVKELVDQNDIFSGGLDPVTEGFVRLFFRGESMARARGRDRVASALNDYTEQARLSQPGHGLFDDIPPVKSGDLLENARGKLEREEGQTSQQQDIFGSPSAVEQNAGQGGREGPRREPETLRQQTEVSEGRNVPSTDSDLERDRADAATEQPGNGGPVQDGRADDDGNTGAAGEGTGGSRGAGQRDRGVPGSGTVADGERSDQPVYRADGQFEPADGAAGDADAGRGGVAGGERAAVEQQRAEATLADAPRPDDLASRLTAQKAASSVKTEWGNRKSIDAALPLLLEPQRDDVLKAETRFDKANGILFTNGTGTGKTASGLGIAKRFYNAGKRNIIVVVPSDKIASDWVKFAGMLDMPLHQLADTTDNGGDKPVVTTYANFSQNPALFDRNWDMVIADESHYLSSKENGDSTGALDKLRALTGHPRGFYEAVRGKHPKEWEALVEAQKARSNANGNLDIPVDEYARLEAAEQEARAAWEAIEKPARAEWQRRWEQQDNLPKVTFLSATPFAYAKNTDYAEGYLFHYVDPKNAFKETSRGGYNSGGPREQFMMQNFGYRMRYNKLTAPESGVNAELMEQAFNERLQRDGALSGRRLDVPHDYERRFVLVEDAIGKKIDDGLKWLMEAEEGKYRPVYEAVMSNFDYQRRMYLLEAIKAKAAVPHIQQQLDKGRKVVVFHDYNKGGGFHPFADVMQSIADPEVKKLAKAAFNKRPDLLNLNLEGLASPIETLTAAYPDALLFNGTVPKKQRRLNADLFNDDESGRNLIVVQSDAGREGVSLHDTTGKHQRVLVNLGMPTKPVAATQIEGRTYRTGQASDAIFHYLTTGTGWEASAFARKIAERASTAENLALGTEARGLKQAFIDAYGDAAPYQPGENEGKGGKAYDRALSAGQSISPFDRAKTFYYAQQKNSKARQAREGVDYFATPEPVGYKMVEWAGIRDGEKALEPSAGHGAIARFFPPLADVTMVEPSYDLSQRAALANGNARIVNDRFENLHISNKYDAIVMNPPYGVGGKTAIEHMEKAAVHLRDGGRIVALIPTGPAADKRYEQWMYGTEQRPVKPLLEHPTLGSIYAGDTVRTRAAWAPEGRVVRARDGALMVKVEGRPGESMVSLGAVTEVQPTGARTREVRPAEGIYTVGEIRLPQVTFERAGTKMATRIVILEKQTDRERAPNARAPIDLTDVTDIRELFDRLESLEMPGRRMTAAQEQAAEAERAEQERARQREEARAKKAEPGAPKAANPDAVGTVDRAGHEIIEHVTKKGTRLRGAIRTDLTKEQAQSIDPYTFRKKNEAGETGWFIRERHLEELNAKFPLRFSISEVGTRTSADLLVDLRAGPLGSLIDRLLANNSVMLHDTAREFAVPVPQGAQGFTENGVIHLIAENLRPGTASAVLLHEAFHNGAQSLLGDAEWKRLQKRLAALYRQAQRSEGKLNEFWGQAHGRVEHAKRMGVRMGEAIAIEEFGAYAIENYERAPRTLKKLVDDLIGAIKAWLVRRFGIQAGQVTPAQLRALAVASLREQVDQAAGGNRFSVADADTIKVDGVERPTRNSAGQPIHPTEEGIRNFWHWFGNSKVVDENGKPLVVYHGTPNGGFSVFSDDARGTRTSHSADDVGLHFTDSPSYAEAYSEGYKLESIETYRNIFGEEPAAIRMPPASATYPVYLSIQNPMRVPASKQINKSLIEQAKSKGHDGIIADMGGATEYVVFQPEQIKSAIGNNGDFDPNNPDIRYSVRPEDQFDDLNDKQKSFLSKIGPKSLPQTIKERWQQLTDNLALRVRQAGIDRYAALMENDKALLGDDMLEGSIADSGWVLARMSGAAGGALSAMLNSGRIYLDAKEKVIDIKEGTEGFAKTLARLGSPAEIDRFMGWVAANRARKLLEEGRENLFTPEEIEAAINLSGGKLANGKSRGIAYARAWKEFQQYRDDVLAIAEQSGIISPEQRAVWTEDFYVPFYRVLDEDSIGGPSGSSGLSRQQAVKKLKGGKQNLNDLLENTLMNYHHLLQASLKNQAAVQAVKNAVQLGIAEPTTEGARDKKMSTFVNEGGQKVWYNVSDPLTFKALSALSDAGLNTPAMKVGRAFKRFFTNMTTITPQFIIANALRDTLSAMATSPTDATPFKTAIKGAMTYGNDADRARMLASGAAYSFGHVYGNNIDDLKASITGSMRNAKVLSEPRLIPRALMSAWRQYHKATDLSENMNRAGIWKHELDAGKGKLKAAFEARDLMPFDAHGDAVAIRVLTDLVPFLNARLQGLDKLYRSGVKPTLLTMFGKGSAADKKAFARFAAVVGALSLASMALFLANWDDDEYRKLEDWQRDTYWVVRVGESMFFIPKPFEVGAIATMTERLLEQFVDPTVGGKKFAQRFGHMLSDTFAFNPIPQVVKPLYEVAANQDTFSGRPIEDQSMQKLSPSLRSRPDTSRLANSVSGAMEKTFDLVGAGSSALSPVQIDHLVRAYTGQVGATALATADTLWRSAGGEEQPARRWYEYQPIRRFYKNLADQDNYTRYGTDFYNALKESERAYSDVMNLAKFGQTQQAMERFKDNEEEVSRYRMLNKVSRTLSKINSDMKRVQMDKAMDGEAKRMELDRLRGLRNMITEQVGKALEQRRTLAAPLMTPDAEEE